MSEIDDTRTRKERFVQFIGLRISADELAIIDDFSQINDTYERSEVIRRMIRYWHHHASIAGRAEYLAKLEEEKKKITARQEQVILQTGEQTKRFEEELERLIDVWAIAYRELPPANPSEENLMAFLKSRTSFKAMFNEMKNELGRNGVDLPLLTSMIWEKYKEKKNWVTK